MATIRLLEATSSTAARATNELQTHSLVGVTFGGVERLSVDQHGVTASLGQLKAFDDIASADGASFIKIRVWYPETFINLSNVLDPALGVDLSAATNDIDGMRAAATANADTLTGSLAADLLIGAAGDDSLNGSYGSDTLYGGDGNDFLFADAGDDVLDGGKGNDTLFGGNGNDILNGLAGDDRLNGGAGDDTYVVNSSRDVVIRI